MHNARHPSGKVKSELRTFINFMLTFVRRLCVALVFNVHVAILIYYSHLILIMLMHMGTVSVRAGNHQHVTRNAKFSSIISYNSYTHVVTCLIYWPIFCAHTFANSATTLCPKRVIHSSVHASLGFPVVTFTRTLHNFVDCTRLARMICN